MRAPDVIWTFGLLGTLFLGLLAFRLARQRTSGFREAAAFKARLPNWIKQFEVLAFSGFVGAGMVASAWVFNRLVQPAAHPSSGTTGIYFAIGSGLIAVPAGALAANVLSWLLPPVRAANLAAMAGSRISFWSSNRGLFYFAAVSAPLGVLILLVAIIAPWSR